MSLHQNSSVSPLVKHVEQEEAKMRADRKKSLSKDLSIVFEDDFGPIAQMRVRNQEQEDVETVAAQAAPAPQPKTPSKWTGVNGMSSSSLRKPNLTGLDDIPEGQALHAPDAASFTAFIEQMNLAKGEGRLQYAEELRVRLQEDSSLVSECVELGGLLILTEFLKDQDHSLLQIEVARIFSLISSTRQGAMAIAHAGSIHVLCRVALNPALCLDIMHTLTRIGTCSPQMNQLVLESDIIELVSSALKHHSLSHYDVPVALELITSLCGNDFLRASWDHVQVTLPAVATVFLQADAGRVAKIAVFLKQVIERFPQAVEALFQTDFELNLSTWIRCPEPECARDVIALIEMLVERGRQPHVDRLVHAGIAFDLLAATKSNDLDVKIATMYALEKLSRRSPELIQDMRSGKNDISDLLDLQFDNSEIVRQRAQLFLSEFALADE